MNKNYEPGSEKSTIKFIRRDILDSATDTKKIDDDQKKRKKIVKKSKNPTISGKIGRFPNSDLSSGRKKHGRVKHVCRRISTCADLWPNSAKKKKIGIFLGRFATKTARQYLPISIGSVKVSGNLRARIKKNAVPNVQTNSNRTIFAFKKKKKKF